jgi:hypothetical protein
VLDCALPFLGPCLRVIDRYPGLAISNVITVGVNSLKPRHVRQRHVGIRSLRPRSSCNEDLPLEENDTRLLAKE